MTVEGDVGESRLARYVERNPLCQVVTELKDGSQGLVPDA